MTKEKLISASKDLFLRYGIKSVSMDDIARHLGVSKKTIYQHVLNKKNLVQEVFRQHIQIEKEATLRIVNHSKDAIDEFIQIGAFTLAFIKIMKPTLTYDLKKYHKDTWNIMEDEHFQFIKETVINNLNRGTKEKLYRASLNTDIVTMIYMHNMKYIINNPIEVQQDFDLATVYKEIISQHIYSVINKDAYDILEQYLQKLDL